MLKIYLSNIILGSWFDGHRQHWVSLFLFGEGKKYEHATNCFCLDMWATVWRLLSQYKHHKIRYLAKSMVGVSNSDSVTQFPQKFKEHVFNL